MKKEDYELHLLRNVEWWLYHRKVSDIYSEKMVNCYHGNVFGVHVIMEVEDLKKLSEKHNEPMPNCIIGG